MMRGEARRAVGLMSRAAGESGWRAAALVMAWRAERPPGGAMIWIAFERLTGLAGVAASRAVEASSDAAAAAAAAAVTAAAVTLASETAYPASDWGSLP